MRALLQKGVRVFLLEVKKFPTIVYKRFRTFPVHANTLRVTLVKAAITLSKVTHHLKLAGNVQPFPLRCCHS